MRSVENYLDGRDLAPKDRPSCGELVGRKVMALPRTLWSGLVLTIAHFVQALFRGLVCNGRGAVVSFKKMGLDLKEAGGHFVTLFNDRLGCQIVEEARRAKDELDISLSGPVDSDEKQDHSFGIRDEATEDEIMSMLSDEPTYQLSMVGGDKTSTTANDKIGMKCHSKEECIQSIFEEVWECAYQAFEQDPTIKSVAFTLTIEGKVNNFVLEMQGPDRFRYKLNP